MADNDTDPEDRTLSPSEKRLAGSWTDGRIARSRRLTSFCLRAGTLAGIAAIATLDVFHERHHYLKSRA